MSERRSGPVLIELETPADVSPADAPPISDTGARTAMGHTIRFAARPPSPLVRWFWRVLLALLGMMLSVAAWDFATGLLARNTVLGGIVAALFAVLIVLAIALAGREAASFARLGRIDSLRQRAAKAASSGDAMDAARVADEVARLYEGRSEMAWALRRFEERKADVFDAHGHLNLAERVLLAPLDDAASEEVVTAARQIATVTAVVPLALADVAAALFANLRMIRRIAEIYGGRSGTLGNWRLTRSVMAHLVATGAVAVGDDLIGSVAGGGLVAKLSRRFGEGIVNGALTARVGVAAMEVCRPLPFESTKSPRVTSLVQRALTGLFARSET